MDGVDISAELGLFRAKLDVAAVIGAVTDADGLVALDVVGTKSRTDDEPATVDHQWHIGSCGKSITALLYARLVEAGKAEWGVPIGDLFDDIATVDGGWAKPTIDDLLRCRAGVAPNPNDFWALHRSTDPIMEQRTSSAAEVLSGAPNNPGEFVYSNLGYCLVGAAIDRLAGMSYEDALFEYVFNPLSISSVGFGAPPDVRGHHPRLRLGPLMVGRGKPAIPSVDLPADNPPLLNPAGRMHLSISDWATFQRVFLNDGAPLLKSETLAHLLSDPGNDEEMVMGWGVNKSVGASFGMQGSNTMWGATAIMDLDSRKTALTITNDGRVSVVSATAQLASRLLDQARSA